VGQVRKRGGRVFDPAERGRVVKRCKALEPVDLPANLVVDQDRSSEPRPAVDDSMGDGV